MTHATFNRPLWKRQPGHCGASFSLLGASAPLDAKLLPCNKGSDKLARSVISAVSQSFSSAKVAQARQPPLDQTSLRKMAPVGLIERTQS